MPPHPLRASYPGFSRTYVFVREVTEQGVLDALRERRTVAVDRDGRSYGDAELIRLAEANGGLPRSGVVAEADGWSELSRAAALAGMLVALVFGIKPGFKPQFPSTENASRTLPGMPPAET